MHNDSAICNTARNPRLSVGSDLSWTVAYYSVLQYRMGLVCSIPDVSPSNEAGAILFTTRSHASDPTHVFPCGHETLLTDPISVFADFDHALMVLNISRP